MPRHRINRNNGEEDVIPLLKMLSEHRIRTEATLKCKEIAVLHIAGQKLPTSERSLLVH